MLNVKCFSLNVEKLNLDREYFFPKKLETVSNSDSERYEQDGI